MMNVLELLLERKNKVIFLIGLGILSFAAVSGFLLLKLDHQWYGIFPFFVEAVSLLLYLQYLHKKKNSQIIDARQPNQYLMALSKAFLKLLED